MDANVFAKKIEKKIIVFMYNYLLNKNCDNDLKYFYTSMIRYEILKSICGESECIEYNNA